MIKNLREDIKDFSCSTSVDGKEHNGVIGIRTSLSSIGASVSKNCMADEKTQQDFLNINLTLGLLSILYHLTDGVNTDSFFALSNTQSIKLCIADNQRVM